jgi:hypothetical protein
MSNEVHPVEVELVLIFNWIMLGQIFGYHPAEYPYGVGFT